MAKEYSLVVYTEGKYEAKVTVQLTPITEDMGEYTKQSVRAKITLPERAMRVFTVDELLSIADFLDVIADEMES